MNKPVKLLVLALAIIAFAPSLYATDPAVPVSARAAESAAEPKPAVEAWHADGDADDDDDFDEDKTPPLPLPTQGHHHHYGDREVVSIFHDSHLGAGEKASTVVSVFGSASSDGEADQVVSVFGDTRASGSVHDTAVAVFGNLTIDGEVQGDAVAVFGNVTLGPHAVIDGDVNAVVGNVIRDPQAMVHGGEHGVSFGIGSLDGLHLWLRECLIKGRPLAFLPGLGWAWTLAIGCLGLYMLIALLFRDGVSRCVDTLEREAGHSALAAFLMVLLTPVLLALLCVTVIGIAAVPFVLAALLGLSLFGKTVALAWVGRRAVAGRPVAPLLMVAIGGVIALLLYVVPIVGLVVYKLLGFFGVGAVVYTLILKQRTRQEARDNRLHATQPAAMAAAAATGASAAAATRATTPGAGETLYPPGAAAVPGGFAEPSAAPPGVTPPPEASPPPSAAAPEPIATYPRAGFWVRMVALFIDTVLVGFVLSFGHHHLGQWQGAHHLHLVALGIYGALMWKLRGSTIGGLALDLRVVRLDGRPMTWETAIVRALGCFVSLFVCGLGFIWIAVDPQRQAWHDKIAGTAVVRVPKGTPLL